MIDTREALAPLMRIVSREFDSYLLLTSEKPPRSLVMPSAYGCMNTDLDLAAQPWFAQRGEWVGRRPCVQVNDARIIEEAETRVRNEIIGTAIHEIAHTYTIGIDRSTASLARQEYAAECFAYHAVRPADKASPPWVDHGAEFIRRASHLRYRAMHSGAFDGTIQNVFENAHYDLSSSSMYWHEILPECAALVDVPIFELAIHRPPQGFIDLWRGDVLAWADKHAPLSDTNNRVVDKALAIYGD